MINAKLINNIKIDNQYRWIVVFICWVAHTFYFLNYMTIGVLAPFIKSELNISSGRVGFLSSAITMGSTIINIPAGVLSDMYGAKRVMGLGLLITGLSAILISLTHSYLVIFSLLILMGIGIGCNQTPAVKAVIMWFPLKGRATALGIKQSGSNMGGLLASFLLPVIALQFHSWRYSFVIAGLAAIISAILIFFVYQDPPPYPGDSSQATHQIKVSLFRLFFEKDFILICLIGILFMAAQLSFLTYFVLYVNHGLSLSINKAGLFLALAFIMGGVGRVGWSMVSDYLSNGRRRITLIFIGMIGAFTSGAFVLLRPHPSTSLILFFTILFGLTGLGWNAVYLTMAGEFPGKKLIGIATGIAFVIPNIGAIIGPPIFGYLVDLTGGYRSSWIFICFCMIMIVFLNRIQKKERMVSE